LEDSVVLWQEDTVELFLVYITVTGLYNSAAFQVWHIMATAAGTDIFACFIMQNEEWCCVQENGAEAREEKQALTLLCTNMILKSYKIPQILQFVLPMSDYFLVLGETIISRK
jgi:hypothetical protein